MRVPELVRAMDAALAVGNHKEYERLAAEWLTKHRRMPKEHRLKDTNPVAHRAIQARHMTNISGKKAKRYDAREAYKYKAKLAHDKRVARIPAGLSLRKIKEAS